MSPELKVFWQRYGLTALLAGGAAAAAAVIGFETDWGRAIRPASPVAASGAKGAEMVAILPGFSLQSLDSGFKESAERPLFSPTRRPPSAGPASVPVMKKGQFKLTGTSVNAEQSTVFLLETANGKTHYLAKGKEINGITVDIVEERRVVLKQGEETEELTLRVAPSPPRPAAPPAAPPGAVPPPGQPAQAVPAATPPVTTTLSGLPPGFGTSRPIPGDPPLLRGGSVNVAPQPAPQQANPSAAAAEAAAAQRRRRFQAPQQ